ncbi:L,D-transpeptidase [Mycobacterium montefiorense]|uniref:Transpeptidase n=1 Tax=Mycobacterium montefiorense TaxID=154654 RepID=A0ABQ0NMS5_9MYCO|nr:L,D-transpeptidase [Mycobacterium montefiorense]GBG38155.1 transpeptidase [Mycobacterium montefiorense]GKU33694.1 putative L,D-transpeptidase 3 [Mycobacterium montefiorense]GKU39466.1 putative L,D-transpeptidase 3 [Mycobacterium montefiorense]GKU44545.1 putative L,D-transpeptidase 3 [Mycobacterium montefiorense]GKU51640.1 putative L,D-transpeptidase 3 [Mycobacterium montefiorense]
MRADIRCAVAVIGIGASVVAGSAVASLPVPADVNLTTATRSYAFPIASMLPARGQTVGVAHPVVVTFRTPVSNRQAAEQALKITSTPAMTGKYQWLDNKVVQWVPDQYWPAHSTIALTVEGQPTEIKTGPRVIGIASISEHTFTVTIDGVDSAPPSSLPAPHHRPHFGEPGVLPASMGRPQYPTPIGSYTVLSKERSIQMDSSSVGIPVDAPDGYLLMVNYAVRITNHGLFVHSAPWAVNSLGLENMSHGCISLSPEDAEWYYNTVNVGDPVIVRESTNELPSS